MAKRYGRNQKRAHRAEIARLKIEQRETKQEYLKFRMAFEQIRDNAFRVYAREHGMIQEAVREISRALGHKLSQEILPHAMHLLECSRYEGPHFNLTEMPDTEVMLIHGSIPTINFQMRVITGLRRRVK